MSIFHQIRAALQSPHDGADKAFSWVLRDDGIEIPNGLGGRLAFVARDPDRPRWVARYWSGDDVHFSEERLSDPFEAMSACERALLGLLEEWRCERKA